MKGVLLLMIIMMIVVLQFQLHSSSTWTTESERRQSSRKHDDKNMDDDDPNYYVVTYFEEETDTTAWAPEIITSDHDVITTAEEVTTSEATIIITHPDQKTTTAKSKLPSSLSPETAPTTKEPTMPTTTPSSSSSPEAKPNGSTTSYHHIVTFTSLTVLYQPAWSNPWRQQIRLAIDKVVQRSVSRRALESIWRQTMTTSRAAAVVSSPPSKDSGDNSSSSSKSSPSTSTSPASKLPAGVTSHLAFSPRTLFPFDRFWLVVVQWVAPLATVALLILCLILEPVSGIELLKAVAHLISNPPFYFELRRTLWAVLHQEGAKEEAAEAAAAGKAFLQSQQRPCLWHALPRTVRHSAGEVEPQQQQWQSWYSKLSFPLEDQDQEQCWSTVVLKRST